MDFKTLVSKGLVEKLKCFSCHNYLSYFPISTCSNNQSLCGRCEAPEGVICFEDEAFEALSQCLHFPCRYQSEGCLEELLPEDVPQHERNCQYRTVPCIFKNPKNCTWRGSLPCLSSHYRENHSGGILKTGKFILDLSVSEESQHLVEHGDHFLIFTKKFDYDGKVLHCAIYHDQYQPNCDQTYQLKIKNEDKTFLLDLKPTKFTEVKLSNLCLKSVDCNSIPGQILSTKYENAVVQTSPLSILDQTNEDLLSLLKCFICFRVSRPPIYRCVQKTNALCEFCVNRHNKECDSCRNFSTDLTYAKNSTLTILSKMVLYPCRYQENGCTVNIKWDEFDSHDLSCMYQHDSCPLLSCSWNGLAKELSRHISMKHDDVIAKATYEGVLKHDDGKKCGIVKLSHYLFRVEYFVRAKEGRYLWSVEMVEDYGEDFMYEIEILDGTDSGRKLMRREKCWTLYEEEFCVFYVEQLRDFCKGDQLDVKFRINVFK